MPQRRLCRSLALGLGFAILMLALPAVSQTAPSYLTTSVTSTGMKQTGIGGFNGVLINYSNTLSSPLTVLVYMDVMNPAGQVAGVNAASCNFAANQTVRCFAVFPSSVPSGNYSIQVFATTATGVPITAIQEAQVAI